MADIKKANMMRKTIAVNMLKSWTIAPKCDYYMDLDAQPMLDLRKRYNETNDHKISFLSFVMKAAAVALKEFPQVNATYFSPDNTYQLHDHVHVGFAMDVGRGLIVLCTRDTDQMDIKTLCSKTNELIQKAQQQKFTMDDVTGSTFTVNNMGGFKRLKCHSAIINQPESAILSFYTIEDRPIVKDGQLAVSKRMNIALSADHRLIDGSLACAFLGRVCDLLEAPEQLLNA